MINAAMPDKRDSLGPGIPARALAGPWLEPGPSRPLGLLAANDTGGANSLAALTRAWSGRAGSLRTLCAGPAAEAFRAQGLEPWLCLGEDIGPQEAAFVLDRLAPDYLLLGSSHGARTERLLCQEASLRGILTVGLVDWWANFGQRFSTPGTLDLAYLPDRVAVLDRACREGCLEDGIPEEKLFVSGNPYWDYLLDLDPTGLAEAGSRLKRRLGMDPKSLVVLVVSTTIRHLATGLSYDENDFWSLLGPLPKRTEEGRPIRWLVRPHPREDRNDLRALLARHRVKAGLVKGLTALESLSLAQAVAGTRSSMLMEAALVGRAVVSIQPGLAKGSKAHLSAFDRIGLPTLTDPQGAADFLNQLITGKLTRPDLSRLPHPLGDRAAARKISGLCRKGGEEDEE